MLKWSVNTKRPDLAMGENPFEVHNMRDLPPNRNRRSLGTFPRLSTGKENLVSNTVSPRTPLARQQRRQSLGVMLSQQQKKRRSAACEADKENNNHHTDFVASPSVKANIYGAFRDVSNITPTSTPTSNTVNSQRRKRSISQVALEETVTYPQQYASTLPTFDIEYSPFGLHAKPFLDTYFNQPRYITPQVQQRQEQPASKKQRVSQPHPLKPKSPSEPPMTPLTHRMQDVAVDCTPAKIGSSQKRPRKFFFTNQNSNNNSITKLDYEETPTSADVGDLTLDHMIDAILESARKEPTRKTTRRRFSCNFKLDKPSHFVRAVKEPQLCESPTYTAGDDPTSDLPDDFFRCSSTTYLSTIAESRVDQEVPKPTVMVTFNEREVKSPEPAESKVVAGEAEGHMEEKSLNKCVDEYSLRRQNALRRKTAKNFRPIQLSSESCSPSESLSPPEWTDQECQIKLRSQS